MTSKSDHEQVIKLIFVTVLLIFPLQYSFARHVGEPYPALLMPPFAGSNQNAAGRISAEVADVVITFHDGSRKTITQRTLFADAPSSQFEAMADIALRPKELGPPPGDLWGRSGFERFIFQHVIPGFTISKIHRSYWTGVEPATVDWMRGRIQHLFPGHSAQRVDIVWYEETYRHDGRLSRDRKPIDHVAVQF